jgi:hypothetical protein
MTKNNRRSKPTKKQRPSSDKHLVLDSAVRRMLKVFATYEGIVIAVIGSWCTIKFNKGRKDFARFTAWHLHRAKADYVGAKVRYTLFYAPTRSFFFNMVVTRLVRIGKRVPLSKFVRHARRLTLADFSLLSQDNGSE